MRRSTIALAAVIVLLLGTSVAFIMKYQKTSKDYADMTVKQQDAESRYTDAFNSIAEIQDSLNAITFGDTTVGFLARELRSEQKLSGPQGREILEHVAVLKAGIQRTKQKIRELETNLHRSGIKVTGLTRMVTNLKANVAEKEALTAQLTAEVDSLQNKVTGLVAEVESGQDTIRAKEQNIEEKRRELANVYYIIGSKRELKDKGIVEAKGGLLGLGKTLLTTSSAADTRFTAIDTDQETEIRIPAKKARVLSPQPAGSYTLVPEGEMLVLHITNPLQFRTVKQVVIVTT